MSVESGQGDRRFAGTGSPESLLPRFYFDIREDGGLTRDESGLERPDLASAEREALSTAGELARDLLSGGGVRRLSVEVRDERDRLVFSVAITMEIERGEAPR